MVGRAVLTLLVGIHWVLPFTPVNPHEETRVIVASLILGAAFLTLLLWSRRTPARAFASGAGLLTLVITISAATGASPLLEGAVVKLAFVIGLGWAAVTAHRRHSTAGHAS